jgi:hypothetical protein
VVGEAGFVLRVMLAGPEKKKWVIVLPDPGGPRTNGRLLLQVILVNRSNTVTLFVLFLAAGLLRGLI